MLSAVNQRGLFDRCYSPTLNDYNLFRGRKMKYKTKANNLMALWLAIVTLGIHGGLWANDGFDKIYIFGDSLSDPGNIYALTGQKSKAPYELIPSAPYAIGGHQFSNGKTWAQRFAQNMNLNKSGKAALKAPGKNGNYAFGGSRLIPDSLSPVPSGADQVNLYLTDYNGEADDEALHVIQFGGNDVRDALEVLATTADFIAAGAIIETAVKSEIELILQLYYSGARHFLVVNVPNIGLTPAVKLAGPSAVFFSGILGASFNEGLATGLASLQPLPGVKINSFDLFSILNAVADSPEDFGISNVESACLMFFVKSGAKCSNPENYLFWDGIHPTAVIHKLVGDSAAALY